MTRKKVSIIGAGPAGIFAAFKLAGYTDVQIFDKGRSIKKRICPREKLGKCIDCNPCNVKCGIGGAGLMSDGKLIFHTEIGNNLNELISKEDNQKLVEEVKNTFRTYGVFPVETDEKSVNELKTKAAQAGIDFVYSEQAHIGSDRLPDLMTRMQSDLEINKVRFLSQKPITSLDCLEDSDAILIAPGRGGSRWLEDILQKEEVIYGYRPVDIGVRVEVPKELTDHITDVVRDMKFYIRTKTFNDLVRTFCVCPEGYVSQETHEGFVLVNGHATAENPSPNTNFAILTTIPLEDSNTNKYAQEMAEMGYALRDGKKITVQRLGDLRRGRKSKPDGQKKYFIQPTHQEAEWGDISLTLAARHYTNIMEGLEAFNELIPGLTNDSTLLYSPEMKFHGLQIPTDEFLQTNQKGIFVAGDGSGISRGIVGAAASGLLAAKGILKNIS